MRRWRAVPPPYPRIEFLHPEALVDYRCRPKEIDDDEYKILKYEFKDGLNRYLVNANAPVHSLKK